MAFGHRVGGVNPLPPMASDLGPNAFDTSHGLAQSGVMFGGQTRFAEDTVHDPVPPFHRWHGAVPPTEFDGKRSVNMGSRVGGVNPLPPMSNSLGSAAFDTRGNVGRSGPYWGPTPSLDADGNVPPRGERAANDDGTLVLADQVGRPSLKPGLVPPPHTAP